MPTMRQIAAKDRFNPRGMLVRSSSRVRSKPPLGSNRPSSRVERLVGFRRSPAPLRHEGGRHGFGKMGRAAEEAGIRLVLAYDGSGVVRDDNRGTWPDALDGVGARGAGMSEGRVA